MNQKHNKTIKRVLKEAIGTITFFRKDVSMQAMPNFYDKDLKKLANGARQKSPPVG